MDKMRFSILPVSEINAREWNDFLITSSESTYFTTTEHWQTISESYILLVRNLDNKLIGGIPFGIQRMVPYIKLFFTFCRVDSSALVTSSFDSDDSYNIKKFIFLSLIKFLKQKKVLFLHVSSFTRSNDYLLFKELGFKNEKCATLVIDLGKDVNEIFRSFTKGNKSSIQKAIKLGVKIKIFEGESALTHLGDYCLLQDSLFEKKRKTYSRIYYKSESFLSKVLSSKFNKSFLALAFYEGQPAAGAIILTYKRGAYYFHGASDYQRIKTSQASNLLQFEIIKYAGGLGFNYYDLGGIPFCSDPSISTHGVYMFKKSFGGARHEYDIGTYVFNKYLYSIIIRLMKYQDHPVVHFLYKLLIGNQSK